MQGGADYNRQYDGFPRKRRDHPLTGEEFSTLHPSEPTQAEMANDYAQRKRANDNMARGWMRNDVTVGQINERMNLGVQKLMFEEAVKNRDPPQIDSTRGMVRW